MSVSVIRGTTPGGSLKTIAVTEEGLLRVSGGSTGGASAENQATEINCLEQIRSSLTLPPTTRTTTTTVLTTALTEASVSLTNIKKLSIHARNSVDTRIDTVAGNTINTPNFTTIKSGNEYYESDLNFTGTLYFSAETIPSTIVPSSTTTAGSPIVTGSAGAFNGVTLGQSVTGTGIPANTTVIARNVAGSSITLSQNAIISSTVPLTFAGAVIRVERWS